jgi:FMN phosphatase YigB (HAD superfamily)
MPRLACFDLDNTLIDRDGAFLAWARWWVGRAGLGADAVDWLVAHDNGGFTPRPKLFAGFRERFGGCHPSYDIAGGINANLSTIRIGHHHDAPTPIADHHLVSVQGVFPIILAS